MMGGRGQPSFEGEGDEAWAPFFLPDPECSEVWEVRMSTGFSWKEKNLEEECEGELDDVLIHFAEHNYPYPRRPCPLDLEKERGQIDKLKTLKRSGVKLLAPAAGEIDNHAGDSDDAPVTKKKKTSKVFQSLCENKEDCEGIAGLSLKDDKVKKLKDVLKTEEIHSLDVVKIKIENAQEESSQLVVYFPPESMDKPIDKLDLEVNVKLEVYSGSYVEKTDPLANTQVQLYSNKYDRELSTAPEIIDKAENWWIRIKTEEDLESDEDLSNASVSTTNLDQFLAADRERDFEDISPNSAVVRTFGDLDKLKISDERCIMGSSKELVALDNFDKGEHTAAKKDNLAGDKIVVYVKTETLNKSGDHDHAPEDSASAERCSSFNDPDKLLTPYTKPPLTSSTMDKLLNHAASYISDNLKNLTVKSSGHPPKNTSDTSLTPDKQENVTHPILDEDKQRPAILNLNRRTAPDLDDKSLINGSEVSLRRLGDKLKNGEGKKPTPTRQLKIQTPLDVAIATLSQPNLTDNLAIDKVKEDNLVEGGSFSSTEAEVDPDLYEEHSLAGFVFQRRRRQPPTPTPHAVTTVDTIETFTNGDSNSLKILEEPEVKGLDGDDALKPDCCFCGLKQDSVQDLKTHSEICSMKTLYYKVKPYLRHKTPLKGVAGGRALCKVCKTDFKVMKLYKLLKHVSKCFLRDENLKIGYNLPYMLE